MKRWILAIAAATLLSAMPMAAEAHPWRCWRPVPRVYVPAYRPYVYYRPPLYYAPRPLVVPGPPVPYGAYYRGYWGPSVGVWVW